MATEQPIYASSAAVPSRKPAREFPKSRGKRAFPSDPFTSAVRPFEAFAIVSNGVGGHRPDQTLYDRPLDPELPFVIDAMNGRERKKRTLAKPFAVAFGALTECAETSDRRCWLQGELEERKCDRASSAALTKLWGGQEYASSPSWYKL